MTSMMSSSIAAGLLLVFVAFGQFRAAAATQTVDAAPVNVIATNAFAVLRAVPLIGLEKSRLPLEGIIKTHHDILRDCAVSLRQFSLVLADAVGYAIVSEIHRAQLARLTPSPAVTTKIVPFEKATAVRLWKANRPDFPTAVAMALKGTDTVTSFAAAHFSAEQVLNGEMIAKAPLETVRPRIRELCAKALRPVALGRLPSADEHLLYVLSTLQAFRDLDTIMTLYEKDDLPVDSMLLREAIDREMKQCQERRADDGMKATGFKVWLTYRRYCPEATTAGSDAPGDGYCLRLALSLAPFMNSTNGLPDLAQRALGKMAQGAERPQRE